MGDIMASLPVTEAACHITAPRAWKGAYGHIIAPRAWGKSYYDLLQEGHNVRCYSAQKATSR
jgi:hypothetical protein